MHELQRRPGEKAPAWLERLLRMDETGLSDNVRRTLTLCRGYAVYLSGLERSEGRPLRSVSTDAAD